MQKNEQNKINVKLILAKIVLFAFVLLLLFSYSIRETNNQQFNLQNAAFLYEGNELVGVNTDDRAEELTTAQQTRAEDVTAKADTTIEESALSTKVIQTPSLVKFSLSDDEQIENIDYAKQQTKLLEQGYTISIDGKYKYYVKDKETVEWAIDKVLLAYLPSQSYLDYYRNTGKFKPYTEDDMTFTGIQINNDIKVSEGYTTGSKYIEEQEDLLFDLFHKDQNKEYDAISDTASIKSIKKENKMSDTTFKLNNPTLSDDTVTYNGQPIVTNDLDPILEVVQTFETKKTKSVNYETVKETDDTMLEGQFEVETEGEEGEKEITYENQMVNGEVVSTEKKSEEVIKAPVHEVIVVGNAPITNSVTVADNGSSAVTNNGATGEEVDGDLTPSTATSGGFIWPSSSHSVTCEFGCYSGHTGIDIQSYYGGPEYAAKAGTVVTSGWSNYGYGYHVVIDHGGGVKTLYAHQPSQPPVSVGQHVEQGQVIGFEGQTGNASGHHLHFEVQINGTAVNPRGYIS